MPTTNPNELTCREIVELVTGYLEGALSTDDRRRFEDHLADCPFCTIYLEQMRLTIATLGRLPEETMSAGAVEALRERFRGWR